MPTAAGFLFLAVVLDAWSRRIVGWAMATDLRARLVLDALDMAVTTRTPADVVHHSDQGSQYTSLAFGLRCAAELCLGAWWTFADHRRGSRLIRRPRRAA
nr:DDE-type integrase/transposase/recombinase [Roseomonas sp. MO-31]